MLLAALLLAGCSGPAGVSSRPMPTAAAPRPIASAVGEPSGTASGDDGPATTPGLGVATALPTATPGPAPVSRRAPGLPAGLANAIAALIAASPGVARVGLVVKDAATGDAVRLAPDEPFPAASLYKLFVLWCAQVEIRAGGLADDTPLVLTPATDDADEDGYRLGEYGDAVAVAEARRLMIVGSNNTAAWLLVEALGGWGALAGPLRANGFDATGTTPDLVTTPREVARFLEGLADGDLDPALAPADYALMLDLLRDQELNEYLSPGFPPGAAFAHKTGNLDGALHDAGILALPDGRTLYLAVLTEGDYGACLDFMRALAALVAAPVPGR